ncbi:MAG TPA: methyltransferase domain-containing protein [Gammaproteobacteria bacterium]|nr:methyltransferase domain-containing protein [Gammaproteobacteria bacterium]
MEKTKSSLLGSKKYIASSQWNGNYYATHSDWQFRIADIALSQLQIPSNAKILDIGCGDGRFTKHLANLAPNCEILGLDPSVSMLSTAQNNIASNVSFVLGDAMDLPFVNQFDRIVAFNSLHWVSEIKVALKQVDKALLPGGQVLILVAPIQVRHPIHKIIDEVAKRDCWRTYFDGESSVFHFFSCAEWASLIEEAGLIPEKLQLIDASLDYKSIKEFSDSLKSWIPFGTIPEDKRDVYVRDIVEAYIQITPCSPQGTVYYHIDELLILASKQNLVEHRTYS